MGLLLLAAAPGWAAPAPRPCLTEVIEGEVRSGESFQAQVAGGLEVRLEAVPAGWVLRVLPGAGARLSPDFAELATPPYRSINPLHLTTEFGFRAQDVVGWNPRRFRFAADARSYGAMIAAWHRIDVFGPAPAGAVSELARLVAQAPEGSIQILDAGLVPGIADQNSAAALVSTHLNATPHRTEQSAGGAAPSTSPLGKLSSLRFRLRLEVPTRGAPKPGISFEARPCRSRES